MDTLGCDFLHVDAHVRYWEDTTVNGVEDINGDTVPFRKGDSWLPIINLKTGKVRSWPKGTTAEIHYKVCDAGEYWLGIPTGEKLFKWKGYYVPDGMLCHNDRGYGDYIIFNVDTDGNIEGFSIPKLNPDDWESVKK